MAVEDWRAAHKQVRDLDERNYSAAVASVVTVPGGSGATFAQLDAEFGMAIDAERAAFADATGSAGSALPALSPVRRRWPCSRGRGRGGPRQADRGYR